MSGRTRTTGNRSTAGGRSSEQSFLTRQDSASQGKWSNDVIRVIESGTVDEIRMELSKGLLNCPDSLLSQSMRNEHALRTPLMAAAVSGDFALFTTVMHAVDRAIDVTAGRNISAAELETKQLTIKDNWGMTLAMVAAESGMVPIIRAVLGRITSAKDFDRLVDTDYRGNTVLMHAASAGRSATFDSFLTAIQGAFSEEEVEEQLRARSGNGWNILMHAARCGDQLGVTAVINACKINMFPSKVRNLVEEIDGDGMTFLMHAASGARTRPTTTPHRRDTAPQPQQTSTQATTDPPATEYARARSVPSSGRFRGIAEEEEEDEEEVDDVEAGGPGSAGERSHAHIDDPRGIFAGRLGSGTPHHFHSPALLTVQGGDESVELTTVDSRRRSRSRSVKDPSFVVFNTAWAMVEEVLWKEEIRKQLKLTDTWGRNILIHAVRSGRCNVFEAAFNAMREHILDPETDELMDVDKEDNNQSIMEAALETAPRDMVALVARRDQELKKQIAEDERASTIEAKMQSFIPGKLIVIFQLLLPEAKDGGDGPLILLLLLTAVAPMLTWATTLLSRDKPPAVKDARHSKMTNLLAAPAIFFWGVGTSDIGNTLGWSKTSSAAALAVASIVIPGLDAFFANQRVEQWFDKWSCQSWRFEKKANVLWNKERKKMREQKEYRERLKRVPGAKPHAPNEWACCGLRHSQDTTAGVAPAPFHSPSRALLGDETDPPTGALEEKQDMFETDDERHPEDPALVAPTSNKSVPTPSLQAVIPLGDESGPPAGGLEEKATSSTSADGEKNQADL